MIDYAFYKRVMEFLARYLGLENEPLYMKVLRYDNVLNGVKVLIAIYRVRTNELITYCAVRFDNTMGKAEPTCNEDREYVERVYGEMT
ncbi:hypothetical protein JCM16161A_23380 [Vulcanisaeta sp. JCM 16161]|uniref:hypothetical protein n=1 Tax=Vulcanisaeta sp. JCM 16161 TaxID=1295372 RepID=UPI0006D13667|nr:hypothetical protein [Vulcanisaeta sp. JCM 16161]